MKKFVSIFLFVFVICGVCAQPKFLDSLTRKTLSESNDTIRMILYGQLSDAYSEIDPDSSFLYASNMLKITRELNLKLEEAVALGQMGYALINMANYPRSLQLLLEAIAITESPASESPILSEKYPSTDEFTDRSLSPYNQRISKLARVSQYAGIVYTAFGNYRRGITYFKQSMAKAVQSGNKHIVTTTYTSMGRAYLAMKELDSALICLEHGYNTATAANYPRYIGSLLLNMGRAYIGKNQPQTAQYFLKQSLQVSKENGYFRGVAVSNLLLAEIAKKAGHRDSTIYYLNNALFWGKVVNLPDVLLRNYTALTDFYTGAGNTDSVVKYQSLIIKINDSLFNAKQTQQFQNIDFDDQQRQQQVEAAKTAYRNKVRQNVLLGGTVVFLLTAFILFRNNRQKHKANQLLAEEKSKVESTLLELKSAQLQLIQSEKMASLGELTAGIAHEIQNPLNFINNFSEVNRDLLTEMKCELDRGNNAAAKIIADDVIANEEKIYHHGQRADAIVKGMMQHSKRKSGVEERVSINSLADEYFRLSYHGLRDKDNTVYINLKTDFDPQVGTITVVPQDLSSVLVNFYNNAFYSVKEKQKQVQNGYEPTVTVSTKKREDKIEITVKDNGEGIPEKVLDKIFQPFFTTKPVGKGTGLGLSLSYDIIKAHRGEIKVNNQPGEGVEFVISLPED